MLNQRTASAMQLCGSDCRKIRFTDTHTDELLSICSLARGDSSNAGDFSIFFATDGDEEDRDGYGISVFPTAPAVDCTLSLGTPSTRYHTSRPTPAAAPTPSSSTDIQHPQHHLPSLQGNGATSCQRNGSPKPLSSETAVANTAAARADQTPGGGRISNSPGDPLLARRCASCDTTSTPLWRNGPRGPKSLCNACGIRYKKEERRAAFSAVGSPSVFSSSSRPPMLFTLPAGTVLDQQQQQYRHDVYGHSCGCSLIRTAVACKWPPSAAPLSSVAQSRVDELIEVAATQPDPSSRSNVPTAHRWPVSSYPPSLLQDNT